MSPSLRSQKIDYQVVSVSARAFEFPEVDLWLVPRINSVEEEGFKNLAFCSFEADDRVTQSLDFPGIFIGCEKHEYRQHQCNKGIISTQGCSGGNGHDELASWSQSDGCGQGASPRSIYVLNSGRMTQSTLEPLPECLFRGYIRVNHRTSVLSTHFEIGIVYLKKMAVPIRIFVCAACHQQR